MRNLIPSFLLFTMALVSFPLEAQKTFKAVCDRSDGTVKIVDGEDRAPNLVPLKGGFPFYQVAQNWVKENYPDGKCDPAAAAQQNKAATSPASQAATTPQQTIASQATPATDPNAFFGVARGQTPAAIPTVRHRNTSMFFSLLISDFGRIYNLDPPVVPGLNLGIEHLFGRKFYMGTGIHFNTLLGLTDSNDDISSFYFFRVPLFAGFRQVTGKRYWGIDFGVAANTMLKPLTSDSHLSGEIASDFSLNTHTRARIGNERSALEFGFDIWLNDILVTWEGYRMKAYSVGYRHSF